MVKLFSDKKDESDKITLFKEFAKISNQGFGIADIDGNIVYCNKILCNEFMGEKSPGNVIGKNVRTYYSDEDRDFLEKTVLPTVIREGGWTGELVLTSITGKKKSAIQSVFLIRDKNNEPEFFANVITDIKQQKETEKALSKSEERFSKVFHASPHLMAITNLHTSKIIDVNKGFIDILEFTRDELIGRRTKDLKLWADEKKRDEITSEIKKNGSVKNVEVDVRTKKGKILNLLISGEIIDLDNEPHLITIADDITIQRKNKEELDRIFNLTPDIIVIASPEGYLKKFNPAFEKILGYSSEEILRTPYIDLIHPDDKKRTEDEVKKQLAGKPVAKFENRYRHKNGKYKWLSWNATPIEGGLIYGVARDITEHKNREREYSSIIHASMDGFWICDTNGKFIDVNEAYCKLIGYSKKELLGMTIPDVEALEESGDTKKRLEKITRTGYDRFETKHRRKTHPSKRE